MAWFSECAIESQWKAKIYLIKQFNKNIDPQCKLQQVHNIQDLTWVNQKNLIDIYPLIDISGMNWRMTIDNQIDVYEKDKKFSEFDR